MLYLVVEGHCSGISAGHHTINLYIEPCQLDYGYRDTNTGWNGNTNRIVIEEFRSRSNIIGGKQLKPTSEKKLVESFCNQNKVC